MIFTVDMGFPTMTPPPAEHFAARIFLGPALRAQPDRRLVDLVRDGYDAAFEEIVRRYRRPLDRFAAAIVGGRSEDVTQDAFSKALLALRGSEAEIELRPWLYRIVRNTALNDLRDRAPAAEELPETFAGARSAAAEVEAREELAELMERLRALPEPQRAAIVMRELEGLSHEEIAAALGVSGGAARQAIYRARTALRDGLGLLMPLPVLRALADGGGEAAAAGGAIAAGAGASSAGGAVLGGGAVKAGLATVLVAGAVGAGVAVEHRTGNDRGPEAAEAAQLPGGGAEGRGAAATGDPGGEPGTSPHSGDDDGGSGSDDGGKGDDRGRGDDRSGSGRSGSDSGNSGRGSRNSGEGSDDHSGSGSGSGSRHSGEDDDRSGSGSGSDDPDSHSGSSGSDSGSSGSGSGDDGSDSGEGSGSSGSGSGEIESEPVPSEDPVLEADDNSGSGSSGSGSGSDDSTSGSGSDGDD